MGILEQKSRARRKKQNVQRALLGLTATAGLIMVASVAPNALGILNYVPKRFLFRHGVDRAAKRLVAKGQAEWVKQNGKTFLRITEKGETEIAFEQEKITLKAKKHKHWDRKWRMVIFDIPERRRRVRSRLREIMVEVGFMRLQDSVWVYPYDSEDFIALLKTELKIGKDVLYAIVDTIEHDKPIRTHFGLPLAD